MSALDKDKVNVAEDHTVEPQPAAGKPPPPGPPAPDDVDFRPAKDHQRPGFSNVPGAGPNPDGSR